MKRYLIRWVELSKTEKSFEALCELFVKEQLINACPEELAVYLRERDPENLVIAAKIAEQFLIAHGMKLYSPLKTPKGKHVPSDGPKGGENGGKSGGRIQCFTCGGYGHKAVECNKKSSKYPAKGERRCFLCDRGGHLARDCKLWKDRKGTEKAGAALHQQEHLAEINNDLESCIQGNQLLLRNGKTLPFIKSGGVSMVNGATGKMPVVRGTVGGNTVSTLRDTGCSGVVVRRSLVADEQLTGQVGYMLLIDNTLREVPLAKITVDTPYLKGEVEAQCLPEAIYDLIIGNVPGARPPDDPDPTWEEAAAVTTRAQAKRDDTLKPLRVPKDLRGSAVDRDDLGRLQREDPSLEKCRTQRDPKKTQNGEVTFEETCGILYRVFRNADANDERVIRQVMVPQPLRQQVLNVAHSSILGGHLGVKKTTDKITSSFYWPGIHGDITRFCQSCDICQRTVAKGSVPRATIEDMPLIDTPFKRVAVDLVGPNTPTE